jgi:peptidoglycan hydrolase CwlO-like protein
MDDKIHFRAKRESRFCESAVWRTSGFSKSILVFLFVAVIVLAGFLSLVSAQTPSTNSGQAVSSVEATQQEQAQLQQQLKEIEAQIARYQQELSSIKGEKNTLQNKINQLKKQQSTLNLQIKVTNLKIKELGGQMDDTQTAIKDSLETIDQLKQQMAQLIRTINEQEDLPILYTFFANDNLSDIFDGLDKHFQVFDNLGKLLEETRQLKTRLDGQMQTLDQQHDDATGLLSVKILQQQQLTDSMDEQNNLLRETKGRESNYQAVLSDKQKQAAEIRNRIYQLLGVTTQVTFGQAVDIAQGVSAQTGVRAAFLLAVLTQESNLGQNVGTCNRPGDPPEKSWKKVMNSTRDQPLFSQIVQELGLDPDTTPVSCPMRSSKGKQIGWGGAMGPAQFIPSTWMSYKGKVEAITGKTANPWDICDAFLAAGIKLAAGGATSQSGEWAAAMRYFSGSTNTRYRFYGDSVVGMAAKYQADIDALSQ